MIGITCALMMLVSQPAPDAHSTYAIQDTSAAVTVTYLGHSGWAVRINDKLLVFDYQEEYGSLSRSGQDSRDLSSGFIDPSEIAPLDVYVFVTHSHQDHFDPVIYDWQSVLPRVQYFFGWQAGDEPTHNYLLGPRASVVNDDVEVYTINSHHSGVPEVAFLVKVDGYVIYHNGDCRADYARDYEYLRSFTDRIDIAFVNTELWEPGHYVQQAESLIETFNPVLVFPMHSGGEEHEYEQFAQMLRGRGADVEFVCAERKGDQFDVGH